MKKIVLLAGAALLLFSCNQKTEKSVIQISDLSQENLKGKVKQVETDTYTVDSTGKIGATQHHPDSSLKMSFTSNFEKQFYIGGESKDSTGKVTYSSKIKLNDKNDQEELTETMVTKDSFKITVTTYKYDGWDDKGNWTQ